MLTYKFEHLLPTKNCIISKYNSYKKYDFYTSFNKKKFST